MTITQCKAYLAGAILGNLTALRDGTSLYPYYIDPTEPDDPEACCYDMENAPINGCTHCILDADPASLGDTSDITTDTTDNELEEIAYDLATAWAAECHIRMLETMEKTMSPLHA